jgi:hypothetical protein
MEEIYLNSRPSSLRRANFIKTTKFIETEPENIVLIKVMDQNFYEGRISLRNITDSFVIYKFHFTQHTIYSVCPSVYFIKPFENITVNIKRFEKLSYEQMKTKETFLVTAIETRNEIKDV